MENHVEKEQSMATKLALSLTSVFLMFAGILIASIGIVDQVWEHTLGLCMVFGSILLFDEIEHKSKFVKDIIDFIKDVKK
ncbi:MAG: hypothetical protein J5733_04840 [Bacteroidaceae bacterium]|nr:hypothetical protein [Bacteroidaceae bacterium]